MAPILRQASYPMLGASVVLVIFVWMGLTAETKESQRRIFCIISMIVFGTGSLE